MSLRELGLLGALGALWGASFIFIRIASPALGPLVLVEVRVGLASLALGLYAVVGRRRLGAAKRWRGFLLLGALNAAIPFALISAAELKLTASFGAILNSTTPLFGAVIAAVWLGDALTARKVLGLLLGVAGVAVLVGWNPMPVDLALVLAVGASLTGALFYGIGSVYAKRSFEGIPPLGLAVGQLGGAAVVTLPFAAADARGASVSGLVAGSVAGLALLSTALAYLIYFKLLTTVGPAKTLTVTFLVPVFGVLFGATLLGDPVGLGTLAGLVVILASVIFVNEVRFKRAAAPEADRKPET